MKRGSQISSECLAKARSKPSAAAAESLSSAGVSASTARSEAATLREYREIVGNAPIGICTFDCDGKVRSWNAHCARLFHIPSETAIGMPFAHIFGNDTKEFGGLWGLLLKGHIFSDIDIAYTRSDGSIVNVRISVAPLRDDRNAIYGATAVVLDMTEQIRNEEDQQHFFSLVEHSTDFISLMSLNGRPVYLNGGGRALVGLDPMASLLEMDIPDLYSPESRARFDEDILIAARSGKLWTGELELRNVIDGSPIHVRGSVFLLRNDKIAKADLLAASFHDITEIKRVEESLERKRHLLLAVAEATNYLLERGSLVDAIQQAIGVIGLAAGVDRIVVHVFYRSLEPDDSTDTIQTQPLAAWGAPGTSFSDEFYSPRKVSFNSDHALHEAFLNGQSIRRLSAEFQEPMRSFLEHESVMAVLIVPILIKGHLWGCIGFDDIRRIRHWTQAEKAVLVALAATIGGAVARFQSEGDLVTSNQELIESLERQAALSAELTTAKNAADLASNAKSEFLANMSHEIRTPMTAILGYSDILVEEECSPEERTQHLRAIRQNGNHLLKLINDILDISKIESGKMDVEQIECSPSEIVSEVSSMMRGRAFEKGLAFHVSYRTLIPRQMRTDPTKLRQILINLLGNAIKFTKAGIVTLDVEFVDSSSTNDARLRFIIRDSGIGMTAEQISRLFNAFSQADSSTTRRFGGTGLGLYVCKRLATMLGGDLSVESQYGSGSTFKLDITVSDIRREELDRIESPTGSSPADSNAAGKAAWAQIRLCGKILLAEDGPDNQRLISMYLRKAGAEVEVVGNGKLAVERVLAQRDAGDPFAAVVMDIQMPELDGYAAVGKLRAAGVTTPVVALTAHAMASDRVNCLNAGFSEYSSKPINRTALLTILAKLLSSEASIDPTINDPPAAAKVAECYPDLDAADSSQIIHSELEDDPDMRELIESFIEWLPDIVSQMHAALKRRELKPLCAEIHKLKGTSGNYGFMEISRLAFSIEDQIQNETNWEIIHAKVHSLLAVVRRAVGYRSEREVL